MVFIDIRLAWFTYMYLCSVVWYNIFKQLWQFLKTHLIGVELSIVSLLLMTSERLGLILW